jgi:type IV secretory pathway protease TraF
MLSLAWKAAKHLAIGLKRLPRRAAVALGAEGLGEPARPDRLWKACAVVIPGGLFVCWAVSQVTLVMSPSIDAWAVRANPGPIAKGDLVLFKLSHPVAGPAPVNVTKRALCMPGERISLIEKPSLMAPGAMDGRYYCDGKLLGVTKPYGRNGQKLDYWRPGHGLIEPGTIYVGSAHPSGFDSRYYGPVPIARLTRMEKLL